MNDLTLADLCELVVDCKNRTPPEAAPGERPVGFAIGTPHIINGRIRLSEAKPVSQETFDIWTARAIPREGDIVLTREAPVGRVGRVEEGMQICLGQRTMLLRPGKQRSDSRFLHYFLLSPTVQDLLHAQASGSTVAHLRVAQVRNLKLPSVPDVDGQRRIGAVLGALDDKIAVNERIAATADELLRLQYQQSCHHALESIAIGNLGRLIRDGVPASSLTGSEYYIGLEHMPRRNMWLSNWESAAELASGKSAFRSGDVLFGKLRPYFHKVGLTLTSGVCSTDILVVRPANPTNLGWLLLALSSDDVVAHASAVGDGTRMPRAKWKDLAAYEVPWPGYERATHLNEVVRSLAARVQVSVTESRTLATLRDTLLPQLMSGRLRVKDAEKIVEDNT
ncbi:restriction endonuclease subunit S [Streptomyces wuyuanensis]|uniref:restriction endonuclease subunit S n=1 Tax=Streptomyces wuyuanensis TaxID=1196353 RepID=UPI0037FFB5F2